MPSSRTISSMSSSTCGFSIVGVICRMNKTNIVKAMVRLENSVANTDLPRDVPSVLKPRLFMKVLRWERSFVLNFGNLFSQIWVQRNVTKFYLACFWGSRERKFRRLVLLETPSPPHPSPTPFPIPTNTSRSCFNRGPSSDPPDRLVKTNFIWILFTPCSWSGTFHYRKIYEHKRVFCVKWRWVACKVRRYCKYVSPDMVFREGSWTAHLERFYLSVSVEKGVVELACVGNIKVYITNIDHLRNTTQDVLVWYPEVLQDIPKVFGIHPGSCDTSNCTAGYI